MPQPTHSGSPGQELHTPSCSGWESQCTLFCSRHCPSSGQLQKSIFCPCCWYSSFPLHARNRAARASQGHDHSLCRPLCMFRWTARVPCLFVGWCSVQTGAVVSICCMMSCSCQVASRPLGVQAGGTAVATLKPLTAALDQAACALVVCVCEGILEHEMHGSVFRRLILPAHVQSCLDDCLGITALYRHRRQQRQAITRSQPHRLRQSAQLADLQPETQQQEQQQPQPPPSATGPQLPSASHEHGPGRVSVAFADASVLGTGAAASAGTFPSVNVMVTPGVGSVLPTVQ